jgi:hypothetical protein
MLLRAEATIDNLCLSFQPVIGIRQPSGRMVWVAVGNSRRIMAAAASRLRSRRRGLSVVQPRSREEPDRARGKHRRLGIKVGFGRRDRSRSGRIDPPDRPTQRSGHF